MSLVTLKQSLRPARVGRKTLGLEHTREFAEHVFGEGLHTLRVLSLANGVAGALRAATLSVHAIGQAYAQLAKTTAKSGVKQVDRLLSNDGVRIDAVLRQWVRFVVGDTGRVVIALDWTDFDADDQTTLAAYMVTTHGRAMPLAWKTVRKSELRDRRTAHEKALVENLQSWLPPGIEVTLLADRAFGSHEFYAVLDGMGWDYVIRFRGCIQVRAATGETRAATGWLAPTGRATALRDVLVTNDRAPVACVVTVKAAKMAEPWFLASSLGDATATEIVKLYGRRFTVEETFRDVKDLHFGMGLSATHIRSPERRDRLLLLVAMAHSLLTLLGAASEKSGLDRYLKTNTVKHRTMSLYRQGAYWYRCLPTMRDEWFERLITAYDEIVREHAFFGHFFGLK